MSFSTAQCVINSACQYLTPSALESVSTGNCWELDSVVGDLSTPVSCAFYNASCGIPHCSIIDAAGIGTSYIPQVNEFALSTLKAAAEGSAQCMNTCLRHVPASVIENCSPEAALSIQEFSRNQIVKFIVVALALAIWGPE